MIDYEINQLIEMALEEDKIFNDCTTMMLLKFDRPAKAELISKSDGVLSGTMPFKICFLKVSPLMKITFFFQDGDKIEKGQRIALIEGQLNAILRAERTALNFIQHLSGVATLTSVIAGKLQKAGIKLLDTRKTIPGMRKLQKKAVLDGGGENHRLDLSAMPLLKDNHIAMAGSITSAVEELKQYSLLNQIEVEVKNLSELQEALQAGVSWIMLDNFKPEEIEMAVRLNQKKAKLEVSGGINIENIDNFLINGVDYISMGALTHSAKALDLSLEVKNE